MRTFLLIVVILSTGVFAKADGASHACAAAVGRIILSDAQHAHSNPNDLGTLITAEYQQTIKKLPVAERVEFFWALSINLHFDGAFLTEFHQLIIDDCLEQYLARARAFIKDAGDDPDKNIKGMKDFTAYEVKSLNPLGNAIIHHGILKNKQGDPEEFANLFCAQLLKISPRGVPSGSELEKLAPFFAADLLNTIKDAHRALAEYAGQLERTDPQQKLPMGEGDWFTDLGDPPVVSFKSQDAVRKGNVAYVDVLFYTEETLRSRVELVLVSSNKGWLLHDIVHCGIEREMTDGSFQRNEAFEGGTLQRKIKAAINGISRLLPKPKAALREIKAGSFSVTVPDQWADDVLVEKMPINPTYILDGWKTREQETGNSVPRDDFKPVGNYTLRPQHWVIRFQKLYKAGVNADVFAMANDPKAPQIFIHKTGEWDAIKRDGIYSSESTAKVEKQFRAALEKQQALVWDDYDDPRLGCAGGKKSLRFHGGHGFRMLGVRSPDAGMITQNELTYVFVGMSDDNSCHIIATFPVFIPNLPADAASEHLGFKYERYDEFLKGYFPALEKWLDNDSNLAGSNPPIQQLDEVVKSLVVKTWK